MKIIFLLICIIVLGICGKLPIQSHSFNDLDYLRNLIAKGVDYFKMDVSMSTKNSCTKHSTWNSSRPCLRTSEYVQDICCLAMRGDASSRPEFYYDFNTTEEFAAFLNEELAKIIVNQPTRRLLFAINFQYTHFFQDNITELFLSSLADTMLRYPKNVLIGTGSDDFILEYDRICYGKGGPECTETRKKISKSSMFLQSGGMSPFDHRDFYKRFRNFNIYYKGIENYCKNGFPEWINDYPEFPLIFWQPSNEKQIQYVLDWYTSPACMKLHGRTLSGMAIATNIDPQMLDVYMKKTNKQNTSDFSGNFNQGNGLGNFTFNLEKQKVIVEEQISFKLTKMTINRQQLIFSASINTFSKRLLLQKWKFNEKTQNLQVILAKQSKSISQNQTVSNFMNDGTDYLIITTNFNESASQIYHFNVDSLQIASTKGWPRIQASCMRNKQVIYAECSNKIKNCTIKGTSDLRSNVTYFTFENDGIFSRFSSIQLGPDNKGFILAGQSASQSQYGMAIYINGTTQTQITQILLSLGQNPKIFKKSSGKQYGVLLQNSMCHSAVLINNNGMNKCTFWKQKQFSSLRNVKGLINLIQFNFKDVINNNQVISPCHPSISLAKVMNGANPDIIQWTSKGYYLIASEYLRVQDQDMISAIFCGGSNYQKSYKYIQKSSIFSTFYLNNKNTSLTKFNLQTE